MRLVAAGQFSPLFIVTSFPSWQALGDAYRERAAAKSAVTPTVQALADRVTKGKSGQAVVDALYDWTTTKVRWVGIETGLSGYIPASADRTLKRRYGDCKAATALLIALLKAKGIEAEPALLSAGKNFVLPKIVDLPSIDHVITYVPKYHLFLDPTAGFAPPGALPLADLGKTVVLAGKSPGLVQTPTGPNAAMTTAIERIGPHGTLHGVSTVRMQGAQQWLARAIADHVPSDARPHLVQIVLSQAGMLGSGNFTAPHPDVLDQPFAIKANWSVPNYVSPDPVVTLQVGPGFSLIDLRRYLATFATPSKKFPVVRLGGAMDIKTQLKLPTDSAPLAMPSNGQVTTQAGSYIQSATIKNGILSLDQRLSLNRIWYAPSSYEALHALFTQAYRLARQPLILKQKIAHQS